MKAYGLILAGGRSSRFGSDKAFATLYGIPLVEHVARALRSCATTLAVSGGAGAAALLGMPLLCDLPGTPSGPLAGILAGLAWAEAGGADWLITATCDVPLVPHDMGLRLMTTARAKGASLALAQTSDGPHPLCAAWRPRLRPLLAAALADGAHPSVRRFAADMGAAEFLFAQREQFFNINTPADLEIAQRFLDRQQAHG